MPNDYFSFKQFTIRQDSCAMKVGTDGTLLGAWARGGNRILDIGTGTGLLALMMAQRFPEAMLVGIDIDEAAVEQAKENVGRSPFCRQIDILQKDVCQYESSELFDAIVSNPPYFDHALECPDAHRTAARHTSSLSYAGLMGAASRLLADEGEFSIVIPSECKDKIESEAFLAGFFKVRQCAVKTTPRKPARRYLLAFRKHPVDGVEQGEGIIETHPGERSPWYTELTKDFYL